MDAKGNGIDTRLLDLDWSAVTSNLVHVLVAYLIALPIGWEREGTGRGVGLRTFPLVALASCGYLLVFRDPAGANLDAQSRVFQGLLSGIGFIGGGAILKEGAPCAAPRPPPASGTPGRSAPPWPSTGSRSRSCWGWSIS